MKKRWIALLLVLTVLLSTFISCKAKNEQAEDEEVFASWNDDAPALDKLIAYVESVTDEKSKDYAKKLIAMEERLTKNMQAYL